MKTLDSVLNRIVKLCKPTSVFLYGSRARTDFLSKSDLEIGVLIPQKRYVSRSTIRKAITLPNVAIYPFKLEEFRRGIIDTPFQKALYLRELISAGKTIYGEHIIEQMTPPRIRVLDIIQDVRFNIGYAFAAMHSDRNGDKHTASYELYKSCLYATRDLILLKKRKFAFTYDEIYSLSKQLRLGEYNKLVQIAYRCRQGKQKYANADIFTNISFLNHFIEPQLVRHFAKYGNSVIIK